MKLAIDIPDGIAKILLDEAERHGMSLVEYAAMTVRREGQRLWHIERSRPKEKEPPRPVGRPRIVDIRIRRVGMIGARLLTIYSRRREQLGAEWNEELELQEATVKKAIEDNNLEVLMEFEREQPWVRKWEINGDAP